ncbi:MAG: ISNCY family transposase, partial [Actinomycetota bacterium]|nr:ISNCY family transposase [Actinomycetota bacterium]
VLNQVLRREITGREAGTLMGVSVRHMRRLLAAYREEGAAALAHGNRGQRPVNATPQEVRDHVITLARTQYVGLNHTHLTELLAEREGIGLARSTVRNILMGAGVSSPRRRRPPRHRERRERKAQEGMLLQLDGSPHDWLMGRGPKLTLLLAVDDATGTIPAALFRDQEDTQGYLLLFQDIVRHHGIPLAVYTDRHAVFQHHRTQWEEEHQTTKGIPTQFARALMELGVTQIFALSPEAKGRVERANGTFQDRLVAELRLAGACTLTEATRVLEAFLPRFNARFGVPAAESGSAYRLPEPGLDVDGVLCVKERRIVAKDNTVQYQGRTLQLFPGTDRISYARAHVEVQERLDGRLLVCCQGRILTPGEAPPLATTLRSRAPAPARPSPVPKGQEDQHMIGKLTPNPIWYEDTETMFHHRELVKVGMERARQQGKHIGRPSVTERPGFPQRFEEALEHIRAGRLSRRRAARDMDIGYATLKRLLEARGDGPEADMSPDWEPQGSTAQAPKANTEVSVVIPG